MISALGALHCHLLAVPRVFFAIARDRDMPQVLARVLPKRRTPYVAIIALAVLGTLFAVFGSCDRLKNMSNFGYLLFYAGHSELPRWIPLTFLLATDVPPP